jgi:hypothetical protein
MSFDAMVTEALARMKDTTAVAHSYEVDRQNGQWIVRRASTTKGFTADIVDRQSLGQPGTEGLR